MNWYGNCPHCGHEGAQKDGKNACSNCGAEYIIETKKPPG